MRQAAVKGVVVYRSNPPFIVNKLLFKFPNCLKIYLIHFIYINC